MTSDIAVAFSIRLTGNNNLIQQAKIIPKDDKIGLFNKMKQHLWFVLLDLG
jgi:hypothetical protein